MSFRNYNIYFVVALGDHRMVIKNTDITFIMAERSVALNGLQHSNVGHALKFYCSGMHICKSATSFGIMRVNKYFRFAECAHS
jgi:hypothetical protein